MCPISKIAKSAKSLHPTALTTPPHSYLQLNHSSLHPTGYQKGNNSTFFIGDD